MVPVNYWSILIYQRLILYVNGKIFLEIIYSYNTYFYLIYFIVIYYRVANGGLKIETKLFSGSSYSTGSINSPEKTMSQIINENIGNNEKVYIIEFTCFKFFFII